MQQINLYHKHLKKKEIEFSFSRLAQVSVALFAFLFIIQIFNQYRYYSLNKDLQEQEKLLLTKKDNLKKLQASLPKVKKDEQLKVKLKELETDLINKQAVLDILSEKKLGNTAGFTKHFEGLAKQSKQGLWLTKLHFLQGGTVLDIEGLSNTPEVLPQYLQALSSEKIFKGTEFNSFTLQRTKKTKLLQFNINNIKSTKTEAVTELSSQ